MSSNFLLREGSHKTQWRLSLSALTSLLLDLESLDGVRHVHSVHHGVRGHVDRVIFVGSIHHEIVTPLLKMATKNQR